MCVDVWPPRCSPTSGNVGHSLHPATHWSRKSPLFGTKLLLILSSGDQGVRQLPHPLQLPQVQHRYGESSPAMAGRRARKSSRLNHGHLGTHDVQLCESGGDVSVNDGMMGRALSKRSEQAIWVSLRLSRSIRSQG